MSEKTPIRALIDAVEAGEADGGMFRDAYRPESGAISFRINGDYMQGWQAMHRAYHGSLDAALALHDTLLPGWWINHFDMEGFVQLKTDTDRLCDGECKGNPARAWLLAILRAYEAQQ